MLKRDRWSTPAYCTVYTRWSTSRPLPWSCTILAMSIARSASRLRNTRMRSQIKACTAEKMRISAKAMPTMYIASLPAPFLGSRNAYAEQSGWSESEAALQKVRHTIESLSSVCNIRHSEVAWQQSFGHDAKLRHDRAYRQA